MSGLSRTPRVAIREVDRDDFELLYQFQSEQVGNDLAKTRPRSWNEFVAHWNRILNDSMVLVRTILYQDQVAGCLSCFESDGFYYVGYWLGSSFWGKGITTESLKQLLSEFTVRPLCSRVAASNTASIRVLEKCGFKEVSREWSPGNDRYQSCEEVVLVLI